MIGHKKIKTPHDIMNKSLYHINPAPSNPTTEGRLWDTAMVTLSYEWVLRSMIALDASALLIQVLLFEINCAIFYTNLHELFNQFICWTNWVNSGKFMENSWISCRVMADLEKIYDDLITIILYSHASLYKG